MDRSGELLSVMFPGSSSCARSTTAAFCRTHCRIVRSRRRRSPMSRSSSCAGAAPRKVRADLVQRHIELAQHENHVELVKLGEGIVTVAVFQRDLRTEQADFIIME